MAIGPSSLQFTNCEALEILDKADRARRTVVRHLLDLAFEGTQRKVDAQVEIVARACIRSADFARKDVRSSIAAKETQHGGSRSVSKLAPKCCRRKLKF